MDGEKQTQPSVQHEHFPSDHESVKQNMFLDLFCLVVWTDMLQKQNVFHDEYELI